MNNDEFARLQKVFERRVIKNADGCWGWNGHVRPELTPQISSSPSPISIHRISWMIWNGRIDSDAFIKRTCKSPHCSRPDHLEKLSAPNVSKHGRKHTLKKMLLDLDEPLHRELKVHAARRNMTMRSYILQALINRLKFESKFE